MFAYKIHSKACNEIEKRQQRGRRMVNMAAHTVACVGGMMNRLYINTYTCIHSGIYTNANGVLAMGKLNT